MGPNLVKRSPKDFTWHKSLSLFFLMILNKYLSCTYRVTRDFFFKSHITPTSIGPMLFIKPIGFLCQLRCSPGTLEKCLGQNLQHEIICFWKSISGFLNHWSTKVQGKNGYACYIIETNLFLLNLFSRFPLAQQYVTTRKYGKNSLNISLIL